MTPPNEDFVNFLAFFPGDFNSEVRVRFVIYQLPVPIIAIGVNHDAASRIRRAQARSFAAEPSEYHRMNDAQPRAGQHRDRQLRNHGHVNCDAVARLQPAEVAQNRRHFVDPDKQFLVRDSVNGLILRFRDKNERRLILVFRQVPVHTVVTNIEPATHKPFPERRVTGIQRSVPVLIPSQHFSIFSEAFREIFLLEPFRDGGVH